MSREPVWGGPDVDGVTQSLLSRFLVCRERFRLLVVEGLKPADTFNHRLEYGSMWHLCDEQIAGGDSWVPALESHCKELCKRYPTQQEQVEHWFNVCKVQFVLYKRYWKSQEDESKRKPLHQEEVFNVPYKLPSGRVVRLRGRWDSVDQIGRGGVYLQENKTKGDIREESIANQLGFDLQTMVYLVALRKAYPDYKLSGVRYNVVRRPLSGGKGSIRQGKKESKSEFYRRLSEVISSDPGFFFMRWKVEVTKGDLARFIQRFLNPVLEQLWDWWEWIKKEPYTPWRRGNRLHWRHPFGVWNALNEGGSSELDEYLLSGSTLGLQRTDNLYRELD